MVPSDTASLAATDPGTLMRRALRFAASADGDPGSDYELAGGIRRTSAGWSVVPLRQVVAGVPVLHGVRAVRLDPEGVPTDLTGSPLAVPVEVPILASVRAASAARIAFLELARMGVIPEHLAFTSAAPESVAELGSPRQTTVLRKDPLEEVVVASLVLDLAGRARLLWEIRFRLPDSAGGFLARVSAEGDPELPEVVEVLRTSSHATRARVVRFDPRTPEDEVSLPLPDDAYPPFPGAARPDIEWVRDGTTRGDAADVRGPDGEPVRARRIDGDLVFMADPDAEHDRAAINAFYLCSFLHGFFYRLGFDERAGNFQEVHRDGSPGAGDAVRVFVQDRELPGYAFFDNRADGTHPILELGPQSSGRHSAFDAHLVIHEFAHGVTNRIVGAEGSLHTPLEHQQSRALGEGFSDYWAISILNSQRRQAGLEERWAYAEWFAGKPTGLRSRSYEGHDRTYRFLRAPQMNAHTAGEVWCATLLDLNRVLGQDDRDRGDERGWRVAFDSLALLHPGPRGPHFLHARDAVLSAYHALVEAGELPDDDELRDRVHQVFRDRGMGGDATSKNARFRSAEEGTAPIDHPRTPEDP